MTVFWRGATSTAHPQQHSRCVDQASAYRLAWGATAETRFPDGPLIPDVQKHVQKRTRPPAGIDPPPDRVERTTHGFVARLMGRATWASLSPPEETWTTNRQPARMERGSDAKRAWKRSNMLLARLS